MAGRGAAPFRELDLDKRARRAAAKAARKRENLTLAGAQGGAARGALLLFSYSLGLGVPFLLVGLGVGGLLKRLGALRRNFSLIAGVSGALMSVIGILLISGVRVRILGPLLRLVNRFEPPI